MLDDMFANIHDSHANMGKQAKQIKGDSAINWDKQAFLCDMMAAV